MTTYEDALSALSDPTRRTIFERLARRPQAVGELAGELPVSRPAVSQHLKVLKDAGLVRGRRVGNRRVYQLNPDGIGALRAYLDGFWNQALAAFKDVVEQDRQEGPMTMQAQATAVTAAIDVKAPVEQAFRVLTEDIGSWWNPEQHILEGELAEMVFEPREGGHVYDRATDGRECRWARVLAYDPPNRVVFSWDISLAWQIESDPARTSEIEVSFIAESDDRTRVEDGEEVAFKIDAGLALRPHGGRRQQASGEKKKCTTHEQTSVGTPGRGSESLSLIDYTMKGRVSGGKPG